MKFRARLIQFGLVICILTVTGCDVNEFRFTKNGNVTQAETNVRPLAVLTVAPSQQWFGDVAAMLGKKNQPVSIPDSTIRKTLPGVDLQQAAGAFLFNSEKGVPEFVFFLPVVDYAKFLDQLGRHFPLKRAYACRVRIGRLTLVVKQVGGYAAFGTSVDGINAGSRLPETYLQELPADVDFSVQLQTKFLAKMEKKNLVEALEANFGESVSELVNKTESINLDLKVDAAQEIGMQIKFTPVPDDANEHLQLIKEALDEQGLMVSTEIDERNLLLDFEVPPTDINSTWAQIQPALLSAFESRLVFLAKRSARYQGFGLPKIIKCEPNYLPTGATVTGGGGGGGGVVRRRGGG